MNYYQCHNQFHPFLIIGSLMKKSPKIKNVTNWSNFHPLLQFWHEKSIENGYTMIRLNFGLHSWWSVPLMKKSPKIENVANQSNFHLIRFWHEKSIENGFRMIRLYFGLHSWWSAPLMRKSPKIENVANWWNFHPKIYFGIRKQLEILLEGSDLILASILDIGFLDGKESENRKCCKLIKFSSYQPFFAWKID